MTLRSSFFTLGICVSTTLSTGCYSTAPGTSATLRIDDRADEQRALARLRADDDLTYAKCAGDGAFGPNCGFITKQFSDTDFRTAFRDKYCSDQSDEQCQTLFERKLNAELAKRYFAANVDAVVNTCHQNPRECDNPTTFERYLLQSHNQHIYERLAKEESSIEEERTRAKAEQEKRDRENMRATFSALNRLMDELHYQSEGGLKCHSYPNVVSGATTYCERR